jgi:hypothetical protein
VLFASIVWANQGGGVSNLASECPLVGGSCRAASNPVAAGRLSGEPGPRAAGNGTAWWIPEEKMQLPGRFEGPFGAAVYDNIRKASTPDRRYGSDGTGFPVLLVYADDDLKRLVAVMNVVSE